MYEGFMMSEFIGVIYKDEDELMCLNPFKGIAVGITDPKSLYEGMTPEKMEVVHVRTDPEGRMEVRPLFSLSWFNPPPEVVVPSERAEWPIVASQVLQILSEDDSKWNQFLKLLLRP
jgi:hypothetical protein